MARYRVNVSLPEDAYFELTQRAAAEGVLVGQLARALVARGLYGVPHQDGLPAGPGAAAWLEPWEAPAADRARWRAALWLGAVDLAHRYPARLINLEADFYRHSHRVEMLGALIAWRAELDAGEHLDPRHELAFHQALHELAQLLKHENPGADVSGTAFDPDAPPPPRFAGLLDPGDPQKTRRNIR